MCLLGPCNKKTQFECLIIVTRYFLLRFFFCSSAKMYGSHLHLWRWGGRRSTEAMLDDFNLCQRFNPLAPGRSAVPPIVFNRAPSQRVWPHMHPSLLAFMYSLRTQSKRQKLCQLGISGKQVSSHFILYKSKRTPGLGQRTMPPDWDAVHVAAAAACKWLQARTCVPTLRVCVCMRRLVGCGTRLRGVNL